MLDIFKTDEQRAADDASKRKAEREESERMYERAERDRESLYAAYPNEKDPRRHGIGNYAEHSQQIMMLGAILDVLYEIRDAQRRPNYPGPR